MNPQWIISAVCRRFGVARWELCDDRRSINKVVCRELCAWLIRQHTHLGYLDIGRAVFGLPPDCPASKAHHTTVMGGVDRVNAALAAGGVRLVTSRRVPVDYRSHIIGLRMNLGLSPYAGLNKEDAA